MALDCSDIFNTISEIATETVFDFDTAKRFYLLTGDKEYCVELSLLYHQGYPLHILDLLAVAYTEKKSKKSMKELKQLFK